MQAADALTGPWTDLASSTAGNPFAALVSGAIVRETTAGSLRRAEVSDVHQFDDPAHPRRFMRVKVSSP